MELRERMDREASEKAKELREERNECVIVACVNE